MVGKEYDIVGIGNAIVDVISDVDDKFLEQQELRKGLMSLVDLDSIKSLSKKIEIKANVSGGSVANSIVALAQNNINTAFIGKVGNDEVGDSFIKGLEPPGLSFNAISEKAIKISKNAGKLVAFSVSDVFCIERFRDSFLSLVNNEADIIFANEEEIKSLYEKNHLDECLEILNKKNKIFAITLGEKGAMIVNQDRRILIKPEKIERLVDTTGAGDLFAAGFLLSFLKNESMENCGATGVSFASKVIQIYGARL